MTLFFGCLHFRNIWTTYQNNLCINWSSFSTHLTGLNPVSFMHTSGHFSGVENASQNLSKLPKISWVVSLFHFDKFSEKNVYHQQLVYFVPWDCMHESITLFDRSESLWVAPCSCQRGWQRRWAKPKSNCQSLLSGWTRLHRRVSLSPRQQEKLMRYPIS